MKTPDIFLGHILESIDLIEKRVEGITSGDFINNVDLQDMVIRRLEIIGEAMRNLPKEYKEKHSEVNWRDPAGMRNALIHGYFDVDLDVVWDTIKNDLPKLRQQVLILIESVN